MSNQSEISQFFTTFQSLTMVYSDLVRLKNSEELQFLLRKTHYGPARKIALDVLEKIELLYSQLNLVQKHYAESFTGEEDTDVSPSPRVS